VSSSEITTTTIKLVCFIESSFGNWLYVELHLFLFAGSIRCNAEVCPSSVSAKFPRRLAQAIEKFPAGSCHPGDGWKTNTMFFQ
jgi:hypothetical protein